MAKGSEPKGPRFVGYFGPMLEVLKTLGGSGSPDEVRSGIASRLAISEEEQGEQLPSGSSRFDNRVAWARFYLTRSGLLDSSRRGIWSLTEKGRSTTLSDPSALQLFKEIHKVFSEEWRAKRKADGPTREADELAPELVAVSQVATPHRERLLSLLRALPREPGMKPGHPDQLPLTAAQRDELDRRLDEMDRGETVGIPWNEVLERIRNRGG